jgi:hypothetical protein
MSRELTMEAHNNFAGQGAVVLDIGGDIGALIVAMPAELDGVEIEIRPVGAVPQPHGHDHSHDDHGHSHAQDPDHHAPHPHVAVVPRPTSAGLVPSAVFADLVAGDYELYERLDGRVRLRATVHGGEVTSATWPT